MTRPVSNQPTIDVIDDRRALIKRGADLCRANPAAWSAAVRYGDQLAAQGVEPDEARRVAVDV